MKAEAITFGVELETTIPATSGIVVGGYHNGSTVTVGADTATNQHRIAPTFNGKHWKAERDTSITIAPGRMACEFVSPILHGSGGVEHLLQFVEWANAVGAGVNPSCGCHITVGVESIIGTRDPQAVSEYARKLAHIARWHAMSLYGQTGTGRHLNRFSHTLGEDVGSLVRRMERVSNPARKAEAASRCGRGMVNFKKLFSHGVIEFRVFAGTLNRHKLMHHLATVLGLCRRAAEVECLGAFSKNKAQAKRTATAANALKFQWDYLGWTGGKRPVALGLIGPLHSEFKTYRQTAERMCHRFDARFPFANL
ncbi:MAG: amidoligase family protein [Luteolibacter sp.]